MPKPKGTCGATKMKILAVICNDCENHKECYGYGIWQQLKCFYDLTPKGHGIRHRYQKFIDILNISPS